MSNYFKSKKIEATKKVWRELEKLGRFLNYEFTEYLQTQSHTEVNQWEFINIPF
jgi:hypothetical protein